MMMMITLMLMMMMMLLLFLFKFSPEAFQMTHPKFLQKVSLAHNSKSQLPTQVFKWSVENFFVISKTDSFQLCHVDFLFTSSFHYVLTGLQEFVVVAPRAHNRMLLEEFNEKSKRATEFFWTYPWPGQETMLLNLIQKQKSSISSWRHPISCAMCREQSFALHKFRLDY